MHEAGNSPPPQNPAEPASGTGGAFFMRLRDETLENRLGSGIAFDGSGERRCRDSMTGGVRCGCKACRC